MKFVRSNIAICLVILLFATSSLNAATYVVSTTVDSGPGSLRQAILDANAGGGGDILMTGVRGTITLATNLPAITASVNIIGPGTNVLTISGSNSFSVFSMQAGTTNALRNLTVVDTYSESTATAIPHAGVASGVANFGTARILSCVFRQCDNYFTDGGAIYNSGNLEISDCLIADGLSLPLDDYQSDVDGGGVFNSGILRMTGCTITNCVGTSGGGIYNRGTAVIIGCVVESCRNDAPDGAAGGGIFNGPFSIPNTNAASGNMTVISCVIASNEAGWNGGGVGNWASLTMSNTVVTSNVGKEGGGVFSQFGTNLYVNCTFSQNGSWEYAGGGIKALCPLTLVGCTISGNSGIYSGGGVYASDLLSMTNCTVSGNFAYPEFSGLTSYGGGVAAGSNAVVVDCTIVSNTVTLGTNIDQGGGIAGQSVSLADTIVANNTSDFYGTLNSLGHNLIKNTNGCSISGDTTGNIYGVDPLLGPLQNNGGPTATHALLPGSPAIDGGPASAAPYVDQRGAPRPFGVADDIGAYEFGSIPCCRMCSLAAALTGGFQVILTGTPGFTYTVQKAPLPSGPWTPFTSVTIDGDGNGVCLDPSPGASSGFYRTAHP